MAATFLRQVLKILRPPLGLLYVHSGLVDHEQHIWGLTRSSPPIRFSSRKPKAPPAVLQVLNVRKRRGFPICAPDSVGTNSGLMQSTSSDSIAIFLVV